MRLVGSGPAYRSPVATTRAQRWLIAVNVVLAATLVAAFAGSPSSLVGLPFGRRNTDTRSPADARVEAQRATEKSGGAPGQPPGLATGATNVETVVTGLNNSPVTGRRVGWVAAENAAAGTDTWKITSHDAGGLIKGYADSNTARQWRWHATPWVRTDRHDPAGPRRVPIGGP